VGARLRVGGLNVSPTWEACQLILSVRTAGPAAVAA
jgi:hypothetical protein